MRRAVEPRGLKLMDKWGDSRLIGPVTHNESASDFFTTRPGDTDWMRIKFLAERRYRANWTFVDGH